MNTIRSFQSNTDLFDVAMNVELWKLPGRKRWLCFSKIARIIRGTKNNIMRSSEDKRAITFVLEFPYLKMPVRSCARCVAFVVRLCYTMLFDRRRSCARLSPEFRLMYYPHRLQTTILQPDIIRPNRLYEEGMSRLHGMARG